MMGIPPGEDRDGDSPGEDRDGDSPEDRDGDSPGGDRDRDSPVMKIPQNTVMGIPQEKTVMGIPLMEIPQKALIGDSPGEDCDGDSPKYSSLEEERDELRRIVEGESPEVNLRRWSVRSLDA